MSIIDSIKKCIKDTSSNNEILFRYTEEMKSDNQLENILLNNKEKIFHINYSNGITYIAIGRCREYPISSKDDFDALKNFQYKMKFYGENKNELLKLFGGVSFNLEQKPYDFWEDLPKGLFFIPEFLIR